MAAESPAGKKCCLLMAPVECPVGFLLEHQYGRLPDTKKRYGVELNLPP
jgi:hypothetical protein